jgi:hypothetical protein
MSNGNGPVGRIKYKAKDGTIYDVGTFWDNGRGLSLSPEKATDTSGRYPKMALAEAAKLVAGGNGYLNVYMNDRQPQRQERRERPAREERPSIRRREPQPDDFDDDLPFK